VVKDIGIKNVKPNRLLVSDEVHLMSFVGQRFAQFGCQNTATTKSWVTNNSNTHKLITDKVVKAASNNYFGILGTMLLRVGIMLLLRKNSAGFNDCANEF
jgi:hypothetical protein